MGKHVVELVDSNGLRCRVRLSLPILQNGTGVDNSSWKVLDEGFLKVRLGECMMVDTTPGNTFTHGDLRLYSGPYAGVILRDFVDSLGMVNDFGTGIVYQGWVINCEPGHIKWAAVE